MLIPSNGGNIPSNMIKPTPSCRPVIVFVVLYSSKVLRAGQRKIYHCEAGDVLHQLV